MREWRAKHGLHDLGVIAANTHAEALAMAARRAARVLGSASVGHTQVEPCNDRAGCSGDCRFYSDTGPVLSLEDLEREAE